MNRSRPKRRRQGEDALSSVDEALGCCRNIATLGQLLAAARADIRAVLETEVVIHAGHMITAEASSWRR